MTCENMFRSYAMFGTGPYIVPSDSTTTFSAWDYARQQCAALCNEGSC